MKSLFSIRSKNNTEFGPILVRPGRMERLIVGPFDSTPPAENLHVLVQGDDKELSYISAKTERGHMYVYTFENFGQRPCHVSVTVRPTSAKP